MQVCKPHSFTFKPALAFLLAFSLRCCFIAYQSFLCVVRLHCFLWMCMKWTQMHCFVRIHRPIRIFALWYQLINNLIRYSFFHFHCLIGKKIDQPTRPNLSSAVPESMASVPPWSSVRQADEGRVESIIFRYCSLARLTMAFKWLTGMVVEADASFCPGHANRDWQVN